MYLFPVTVRRLLAWAAPFTTCFPRATRRRGGPARPGLEALEERQALSTLFLGGTAPGHFTTINAALHAALPGDVIQIERGAVVSDPSGTIRIDTGITLQGDPLFGPAPVVSSLELDDIPAPPLTLKHLNLGNNDVHDCRNLGDLNIVDSTLHDLPITTNPKTVTIRNSTLHDVTAGSVLTLTIQGSTLHSIHVDHSDNVILGSTLIEGNTIAGEVYFCGILGESLTVLTFTNNNLRFDGSAGHCAVEVDSCANGTIGGNAIHFTTNDSHATGLAIREMQGVITDNTFDTQCLGTGVDVDGSPCGRVRIERNDFNANAVGVHIHGFEAEETVIDLGGGPLRSAGFNDFSRYPGTDGRFAIVAEGLTAFDSGTISALNNYWATTSGGTSIDPQRVIRHDPMLIVDAGLPTAIVGVADYGSWYAGPGIAPAGAHFVAARPLVPRPVP
jgi:hypothetical protein